MTLTLFSEARRKMIHEQNKNQKSRVTVTLNIASVRRCCLEHIFEQSFNVKQSSEVLLRGNTKTDPVTLQSPSPQVSRSVGDP
jgi:hypothetical protein